MLSVSLPVVSPQAIVAPATPNAKFGAEVALFELAGTVRALRLGLAPFDVLTPEERAEQLMQLLDDGTAKPVAELSNDELIAIIAEDANTPFPRLLAATIEIDKRLKALAVTPVEAPDAEERIRIETEDEEYHRELTMRRERDVQLDTPLAGRTGWAEDGDAFNADFYPAA